MRRVIPMLAVAGNLARKKIVPPSLGTFSGDDAAVHGTIVSVILIVGAVDIFSSAEPGTIGRAFVDECRKDVLKSDKLQLSMACEGGQSQYGDKP